MTIMNYEFDYRWRKKRMQETKHQRYLRLRKEKQFKAIKAANKNLQKTVAVVGATTVAGLVTAPKSNAQTVTQTPAQRFLNKIIPAAQQATEGKDVYTSVMIAQAALESAWGTSGLSAEPNHNLFGVKGSYNGQSVNMYTLEDSGAQHYYGIYDNFRKYPSYKESMDDYVAKISNGIQGSPYFYSGAWKSRTNSYKDATRYLTGRYATDSAYYAKLNRIIEQYGLTKYDTGTATTIAANIEERSSSLGGQYVVQSGDTLYSISRKSGISLNQLLSLNGLSTSSLILPGQALSLGNTTPVSKPTTTTLVSNSSGANGTYTVKAGDTLYSISRRFGMSLSQLVSANGISTSSIIQPGETLRVVGGEATSSVVRTNTTVTSGGHYTVQAGDTLYSIARRNGMNLSSLLSLNGLSQSSTIYPGQRLTLSQFEGTSAGYRPTASSTSSTGNYTIQAGDTLYSISRRFGMSLSTLLVNNGLSASSLIRPGQTISVSGSSSANVQSQSVSYTSTSGSGNYTVKAGDTLYRIAYNHGISLTKLLSLNGLSANSTIRPGQHLVVSGSSSTVKTSYASRGASTHTVQSGEGLWRIARNYGLTLEELKALNGLSSNVIRVGQVLKVSR